MPSARSKTSPSQNDGAGRQSSRLTVPKCSTRCNRQLLAELSLALLELDRMPTVSARSCSPARGEKAFAAGADIGELNALPNAGAGSDQARMGQALTRQMERMRKPVIVAINGLRARRRLRDRDGRRHLHRSENAKFGQPEVNLGLIPGYGGSQRTTRLVGKGMAMYLCLTGETDRCARSAAHRAGTEGRRAGRPGQRSAAHRYSIASKAPWRSPRVNERSTPARTFRSTMRSRWKPWSSDCWSIPKTSPKVPVRFLKSANRNGRGANAALTV